MNFLMRAAGRMRRLLAVAAAAAACSTHAPAQIESRGLQTDMIVGISAEAFNFESDHRGTGRVDIYVQVPYADVTFVKDGENYTGVFDLTITATTKEKQQAWQKNQTVEVRVKEYAETVSRRLSSLKQFSTDLPPGEYEFLLQVKDEQSKNTMSLHREFTVKNLADDSLALSDIVLVRRVTPAGSHTNIVPNLTGFVDQGVKSLYLFCEITDRLSLDSVRVTGRFRNAAGEVVAERSKVEPLGDARTQMIWEIDTPGVTVGQYVLSLEAEGTTKTPPGRTVRALVTRPLTVRNGSLPLTVGDIDKATEELRYIAKDEEIRQIKDGKTPEERQKRFLAFWAKHNPDTSSGENSLMEEYYARVAFSNKHFSTFSEGWKTDRGMVYIRFGPPQNIERHPFESNTKPYEIWYYYDQNREFIFIDETGFGDYHLQYPTTDLYGRIR